MKFNEKVKSFTSKYGKITDLVFLALLVLFSYCRVNKGLEITDTAYNYTNFLFEDELDDMWYFSTFLSNLLGMIFTFLPGGKTMLGLNIYTGAVRAAIPVVAYIFAVKDLKFNRLATFGALLMAEGLSWCPSAVLYNYLSYLLLLLGVIFIYKAELTDESRRKYLYFVIAGTVLSLNVFVRLPNLCEAALIAAVWFASIIKKDKFKDALSKTLACIAGYIIGAGTGVLLACMTRGLKAYISGIGQMFEGGGDASGQYTPKGLVFTAFSGYIGIGYWAMYLVIGLFVVLVASFVSVKFIESRIDNESRKYKVIGSLKYVISAFMGLFLIVFFLYTNLYTFEFYEYSSMYGINVIVLLLAIMSLFVTGFNPKRDTSLRVLAALIFVVVFVTPLGSNNGMYSTLNNMYLLLPFLMNYLFVIDKDKVVGAVKPMCAIIVAAGFVNSLLFGLNFSFRDGGGIKLTAEVTNNPTVKGMKTIPSNAQYISEFTDVWNEKLNDSRVLVFGNAAGLSFYMQARPAISSVWPSLASYSLEKFEREMTELKFMYTEKGGSLPAIILGQDAVDALAYMVSDAENPESAYFTETYIKKLEILYEFLNYYGYYDVYDCETFHVLAPSTD